MANRNNISQSLHDNVIQAAYNNLDKINYDVYINLGQQKNTAVNNQYPDIIITPHNSRNVRWIIEVETTDSVTQFEALSQWIEYSKLGGIFYLLVPTASRNLAEQICIQNNIKARFGTYQANVFNAVTQINYE